MKRFLNLVRKLVDLKTIIIFLFEKINDNTNEILSRNRIKSLIENQCVEKDNEVINSPSVKMISNPKYRINVPPIILSQPNHKIFL